VFFGAGTFSTATTTTLLSELSVLRPRKTANEMRLVQGGEFIIGSDRHDADEGQRIRSRSMPFGSIRGP
jgi:hypothetical protein